MAEPNTKTRDRLRKRLLNLLDRKDLEWLSGRETPWHADRATLTADAMARWDLNDNHDEISTMVSKLVSRAK